MQTYISYCLDVAREVAVEAGKLLMAEHGQVERLAPKGNFDPVTQADIKAGKLILQMLAQHFPEHSFLSEEQDFQKNTSTFRWIIDPLDGTVNFLHGLNDYCVSIALQEGERTVLGVVYQPATDNIYTAIVCQGAYLNGTRLRVSTTSFSSLALLGTGFSALPLLRPKQQSLLEKFLQQYEAIREPGSAALGLCYVARGLYDGYWEVGLQPWDVAAGALIVLEARGMVSNFDGTPFNSQKVDILASNGYLHPTLQMITNS